MLATAWGAGTGTFDLGVLHFSDDTLVEYATCMCGDFVVVGGFGLGWVGG